MKVAKAKANPTFALVGDGQEKGVLLRAWCVKVAKVGFVPPSHQHGLVCQISLQLILFGQFNLKAKMHLAVHE